MIALFLNPTATLKFFEVRIFQLLARKVLGITLTLCCIAWVFRVALTIIIQKGMIASRLRKEQKVQAREPGPDIAESRRVDEDYDAREKLERVMAAIERLPARQRDVMKMYVFEEMSYEEIAEKTGMSNLTLRVLLSNARKSLRSQI